VKDESNNSISEVQNFYDLLRNQQDVYLMLNDIKYKFESNRNNCDLGISIKEAPDSLYH